MEARASEEDTRLNSDVEDSDEEKTVYCPTRCAAKECKEWWCSWNIHWKALSLFGVVLLYLQLGGIIFFLAERPNEEDEIEDAQQRRKEAMDLLVDTFVNLSNGSLSHVQAEDLVLNLTDLFGSLDEIPAESNPIWEYGSAVFFAITVITTIGYGTIAPVTTAGRTMFVFYALVGIPIVLIFLSTLGKILHGLLDWTLSPIKKKCNTIHFRIITLVVSVVSGMVIFIVVPALIFWSIEPWTYGESVYYCFVTLTTVGFGDFVPGDVSTSGLRALYRICTGMWIWFGLAFVSLLIAEIQKIFEETGRKFRKRNEKLALKLKKRLQQETPSPQNEDVEQL